MSYVYSIINTFEITLKPSTDARLTNIVCYSVVSLVVFFFNSLASLKYKWKMMVRRGCVFQNTHTKYINIIAHMVRINIYSIIQHNDSMQWKSVWSFVRGEQNTTKLSIIH